MADTDDKPETKAELQEKLAEAGKPVSGTKAELEERVAELDREHRPHTIVRQLRPRQQPRRGGSQ